MNIKERTSIDNTNSETAPKTPSNSARIINLVIGDTLVFLIFALIGRRSHGEASGLDVTLQLVLTALPFLAAWFLVAPFLGAYKRGLEINPLQMAKRTMLAWLCAWPVAMILRGIFVDHAIPPWTFWIVTFIANTVLLQIWRVPLAWLGRIRART